MSKSLNFLVILLASNIILVVLADEPTCTQLQVKNSSGNCISIEDCQEYVSNQTCTKECNDVEYAVETILNTKKYKKCITCEKNHVSFDQTKCQDTCQTEIIQTGMKRCLSSISKCTAKLSYDQSECGAACLKGQSSKKISEGDSYELCGCYVDNLFYYDITKKECVKSCDSLIELPELKACLTSADDCKLKLSLDKKICSSKACKSTEIFTSVDGKSYQQCSICEDQTKPVPNSQQTECGLCVSPKIADIASHTCLASSANCTDKKFVLSDGKRCGAACDANQSIVETNGIKFCNDCGAKFVSLDKKQCLDACPLIDLYVQPTVRILIGSETKCLTAYSLCSGVVTKDKQQCINKCPDGQITQEQSTENGKYKLCSICAEIDSTKPLLQTFENKTTCVLACDVSLKEFEDKTCKNIDSCTQMISSDSLKCISTCPAKEFLSDAVDNKTYKNCLKECPKGKFQYTFQSVKYCTAACPESMITKDDQCLFSRKECETAISSDFKTCIKECDSEKKETAVQMNGYKLCVACEEFYIPKAEGTTSQCLSTCPDTFIGVTKAKKCVKNDQAKEECKNYFMSTDNKVCNEKCIYPDLLDSVNKVCVKTCGKNLIPDESQSPITCIESKDCKSNLSSDSSTCITDCSFVKELNPKVNTKLCQSCGNQVYYYDKESSSSKCKDSVSISEQNATLTQQLKGSFSNEKAALTVKQSLSKLASTSASSLGSKKNNKLIIDNVELLAITFLSKLAGFSTVNQPQSIGSKTSIMTVFQNVKQGRKPKLTLSIQSLLGDTTPDLTEIKDSTSGTAFTSIISSVLATNPACSTDNCKFPLVTVKGNTNRRLLADADQFTVEFQVTTVSSNYVCLSYSLETNVAINDFYTVPSISNNGLSATCTVNGPTSLFLDSTCIYLDKSKCPSNNQDNSSSNNSSTSDDGLSAGGIVGIVIGSIAFAAIVGVGSFFLYKRLHESKTEKKETKYIQPPLATEA